MDVSSGLTFIMLCCDWDAALLEHATKSHLSQALYLIGDVKLNLQYRLENVTIKSDLVGNFHGALVTESH